MKKINILRIIAFVVLIVILLLIFVFKVNSLSCPENSHQTSYGKCQCNSGYAYSENIKACEKLRIIPQIKEIPNWTLNLFFFILGFGLVQFFIWKYHKKLEKPKKIIDKKKEELKEKFR